MQMVKAGYNKTSWHTLPCYRLQGAELMELIDPQQLPQEYGGLAVLKAPLGK